MPPRCLSHSLVAFSAPYVVTFNSPYSCHYHSSLAALSTLFWLSVLVRGFHYSLATFSTLYVFCYSLVAFGTPSCFHSLLPALIRALRLLIPCFGFHYFLLAFITYSIATFTTPSRLLLLPHVFHCCTPSRLYTAPSRLVPLPRDFRCHIYLLANFTTL